MAIGGAAPLVAVYAAMPVFTIMISPLAATSLAMSMVPVGVSMSLVPQAASATPATSSAQQRQRVRCSRRVSCWILRLVSLAAGRPPTLALRRRGDTPSIGGTTRLPGAAASRRVLRIARREWAILRTWRSAPPRHATDSRGTGSATPCSPSSAARSAWWPCSCPGPTTTRPSFDELQPQPARTTSRGVLQTQWGPPVLASPSLLSAMAIAMLAFGPGRAGRRPRPAHRGGRRRHRASWPQAIGTPPPMVWMHRPGLGLYVTLFAGILLVPIGVASAVVAAPCCTSPAGRATAPPAP